MRLPSWPRLAITDGIVFQALAVGLVSLVGSGWATVYFLERARATGRVPLVVLILAIAVTCIAFSLLLLGIAVYRILEVRRLLRRGDAVPATVTRRTWFFGTVLHYRVDHGGRQVERWVHLASGRRGRRLASGDAATAVVDPARPDRTLLRDVYE